MAQNISSHSVEIGRNFIFVTSKFEDKNELI